MTNKYLEKIAESDLRALSYMDKAELQAKARSDGATRALSMGALTGAAGAVVGHNIGERVYGRPGRGAVLGGLSMGYMAYKKGLAVGHHKSIAATNEALKKQANEHLKDIKDTATIGALGGVASIGTHHLLTTGRIGRAIEGMSAKGKLGTVAAIGTGVGLAADYAGLKLNKATDKLLPQNNTKEQNVPL